MSFTRHLTAAPLIAGILFGANPFIARADEDSSTVVQRKLDALVRLTPLRKMTVGPDDQYQGVPTADGKQLYFTRKSDLVPHLCVQDNATGLAEPFLSMNADSQQPALNGSGKVAFAYYKSHAAGDICHRDSTAKRGEDSGIECLEVSASEDGERSSPFWKSAGELGFLVRNPRTGVNRIYVQDLASGRRTLVAEGNFWSPSMNPGGKWLVASEGVPGEDGSNERVIALIPMDSALPAKDGIRRIRLALPGVSGFPALSRDERFVYFSHYLNDTTGDGIIDGNDNSVLFRVRTDAASSGSRVFPEQLTSAESNCSYPKPMNDDRVVSTCAIEGTLDLYELPSGGTVPSNWSADQIWNAHRSSRAHAERILLLNSLRFRFPAQMSLRDAEERLLSNHMLAGDSAAARFYAGELRLQAKSPEETALMELTELLLAGRELRNLQKGPEITREFSQAIGRLDAKAARITALPAYREIVRGSLAALVGRTAEAESLWKKAKWKSTPHPLERQFWFELGQSLFSGPARTEFLLSLLGEMIAAPELSHENHVYFTTRLLEAVAAREPRLEVRLATLDRWAAKLAEPYASLVRVERLAHQMVGTSDEAAKRETWNSIDKILRADRKKDYFTFRAMLTRSLLLFDAANEFRYVNLVANLWISLTRRSDSEFAQAREIVARAQLDRGYDSLRKDRNASQAASYFYGSALLTDDLESHSGYLRTMAAQGQRATIDVRYASMEKEKFIEDNRLFVDALLILIDAEKELAANPREIGPYERALAKLEKMTQDRDSAVRHLLMGYSKLQKLERQGTGYDIDRGLFEESHRHFMLTLDQARDNPRVTASALMNLGLLHARVQNHGLAVRFFKRRQKEGFLGAEEEAGLTWLLARSLVRNYQESDATNVLESFLASANGRALTPAARAPFEERLAFSRMLAGEHDQAARDYESLLKRGAISGNENLAKARYGLGRSLFQTGKKDAARVELARALELMDQAALASEPAPLRFTRWEPRRLQLIITGLLAQTGNESQRFAALEQRARLLENAEDILDEWQPGRMKVHSQLATMKRARGDSTAIEDWRKAFDAAAAHLADEKVVDPSILTTMKLFLTDGIVVSSEPSVVPEEDVRKIVDRIRDLLDRSLIPQADLDLERLRIELLWDAYQAARSKRSFTGLGTWEKLQEMPAWKRITETGNAAPAELARLNQQLLRLSTRTN